MALPTVEEICAAIRLVPDFPKPGIQFRDITPVLRNPKLFAGTIELLAGQYREANADVVVGIESRGFIVGAALAYALGVGFVPIRKKGKLPHRVQSAAYSLEYGTDSIELHVDAIQNGQRVLLVDDLLATGGTMSAAVQLVRSLGGNIAGIGFLIELAELRGREKLPNLPVFSLVTF